MPYNDKGRTELVICAVCKKNEAVQKHHLTYLPSALIIDICHDCHLAVHGHAVGSDRINSEIIEDKPSIGPLIGSDLRLVYRCNNCGEDHFIISGILNFLVNHRIPEPRKKCSLCGLNSDYTLNLEASEVRSPITHKRGN